MWREAYKIQVCTSFCFATERSLKLRGLSDHRITDWVRLEGTCGSHLVQPLSSSRVTYSQLSRSMSRCLFLWRSPRMETPSPPRCITGPLAAIKSNQIWNSHESLLPIKSPLQNTFSWRQHGFKCCWTEENNPQGFLPLNSIHRKQTQTALRWWQMCSQAHFIQMCHSGSTGSRERKLWPLGIWYHIAEFSSHSSPMTHYA